MKLFRTLLLFVVLLRGVLASPLMVHAAASLSDVLRELEGPCKADLGIELRFNFGGSGNLVRQIQSGVPGDVFLSADEARMDSLEAEGLLLAGTRRALLGNTLVVVGAEERPLSSLEALAGDGVRRVAIGNPKTVPAGTYAKACLEKAGLWGRVAGRLVPLDNVRTVLAAVEAGNADYGFVYRTDALRSSKVHVVHELPATLVPPVRYPAAVLAGSERPEDSKAFLGWLGSGKAAAVFKKHGFEVLSF